MKKERIIQYFIIGTFVSLYIIVSIISTIHVIDFFRLSNPDWLAISLAIAFEIGAAASLASLIALDKMNKTLIWVLFIILTLMQMMGNAYYAYVHLDKYQAWVELFGLVEEEPITQKRILAIISGAILPIVALGFIKSLVDYIKPSKNIEPNPKVDTTTEPTIDPNKVGDDQELLNEIIMEEEEETEITEEEYKEYIRQYIIEIPKESIELDLEKNSETIGVDAQDMDIIQTEDTESEHEEVIQVIEHETEQESIDETVQSSQNMHPQIRPGVN
jgi:hypothetical protein